MNPYYTEKGAEDPVSKAFWKRLHDRIAVELGLQKLSQTAFSYSTTWQGNQTTHVSSYTWLDVCENWIVKEPTPATEVDDHIKEKISLIEVAFRDRETSLRRSAGSLAERWKQVSSKYSTNVEKLSVIQATARRNAALYEKGQTAAEQSFKLKVDELNTRFRQAGCKLHYHNGFIQISEDALFLKEAEQPFWALVGEPRWKNVDIDMKEAIDRRDNGDRDPSWYAARALESTIKIISGEKGWSHGGEKGAHNYIDNLAKKDAKFIEAWESAALKALFTDIRNPFGHGPGSDDMPSLSGPQTDLAIETCMSWIKSLIKRF
tara:strand:- start:65 stop:1021 length:957 start_codon:yes stop_codon:yes gene_type:complete